MCVGFWNLFDFLSNWWRKHWNTYCLKWFIQHKPILFSFLLNVMQKCQTIEPLDHRYAPSWYNYVQMTQIGRGIEWLFLNPPFQYMHYTWQKYWLVFVCIVIKKIWIHFNTVEKFCWRLAAELHIVFQQICNFKMIFLGEKGDVNQWFNRGCLSRGTVMES